MDRIKLLQTLHGQLPTISILQTGFFNELNDQKMDALGKLLLNCWSAEYALRITPVVDEQLAVQVSRSWTFPQVYYSVLFSTRAFLLMQGRHARHEDDIHGEVVRLYTHGVYSPGAIVGDVCTFFNVLQLLRIQSCNEPLHIEHDQLPDFHQKLIDIAAHINAMHERFIFDALGVQAWARLIEPVPQYMKDFFLRDYQLINV